MKYVTCSMHFYGTCFETCIVICDLFLYVCRINEFAGDVVLVGIESDINVQSINSTNEI